MKRIAAIQLIIGLIGTLGGTLVNGFFFSGLSFLIGSGLTLLNLLFLAWAYTAIIQKKLIALAIFAIVIKYALLAGIVVFLARTGVIEVTWVLVGLGTLGLTGMVESLFRSSSRGTHAYREL